MSVPCSMLQPWSTQFLQYVNSWLFETAHRTWRGLFGVPANHVTDSRYQQRGQYRCACEIRLSQHSSQVRPSLPNRITCRRLVETEYVGRKIKPLGEKMPRLTQHLTTWCVSMMLVVRLGLPWLPKTYCSADVCFLYLSAVAIYLWRDDQQVHQCRWKQDSSFDRW